MKKLIESMIQNAAKESYEVYDIAPMINYLILESKVDLGELERDCGSNGLETFKAIRGE